MLCQAIPQVCTNITVNLNTILKADYTQVFRPQNFMLANLSITSVMTLFVYLIGNLLEQIPGIIHFSSVTCGVLATVLRKLLLSWYPTKYLR